MKRGYVIEGRRCLPTTAVLLVGGTLTLADITPTAAQDFILSNLTATAEAQLRVNSFSGSDFDEIIDPTLDFSAFAEAQTSPFSPGLGHGAAYQDQFGINAVFVNSNDALEDATSFTGGAKASYSVRVTPAEDLSTPVPFKFVIDGGELRIRDFAKAEVDTVVGVSASVKLFFSTPTGDWRLTTVLRKNEVGEPELEVNQRLPGTSLFNSDFLAFGDSPSLDDFQLGFPSLTAEVDGDDVVVEIPRIENEILLELGSLLGMEIDYDLVTTMAVSGLGTGGFGGISDPFGLESMDPAAIPGTQFFLGGEPLSSFTVVPLPPAALLLAPALGVLLTAAGWRPGAWTAVEGGRAARLAGIGWLRRKAPRYS